MNFPAGATASNVRFLSRNDQGGRPDGVQVILHKGHAFIGHMFSDGFSVVDVRDPLKPKSVAFVAAPKNTRSHHLADPRRRSPRRQRPEYLGDAAIRDPAGLLRKIAHRLGPDRTAFCGGLRVFDISKPSSPREIAFLNMPGFGAHRIWWVGGRYAYVSVHFDGFIDHALAVIDVSNPEKPQLAARWWLPGMNRAGGETPPSIVRQAHGTPSPH